MINRFEGRFAFLSNFYDCKIEFQGIEYNSVENFYVAMKVDNIQMINGIYYTPVDFREMVSKINPGSAKRLGSKAKLRKNWDSKRVEFMNWAVREKFKNESLSEMLLSTGDQELLEGNWWHDNFWGTCLCEKCGDNGKNTLGKILMDVRNELRGIKRVGLEDILK